MQPCPTCGGMGIDANGYCTQCRTYRGIPQTPPPSSGAPYSGPPYGGSPAPYGGSPAPYGGYPTSSGPGYPQPTSSGPGYPQPTSGGAPTVYPSTTYGGTYGAPTTPPKKSRNSFMVPLLALSATLVVLVVAIVVVVVVKNSGDKQGAQPGSTSAAPGKSGGTQPGAALVDACVVGTWDMTSYTEDVPIQGVGSVPFSLVGSGPIVKFSKEGKGSQEFGSGVNYSGNVTQSGTTAKVNLKLTGAIKFDFRTNDNVMSFSNMTSTAKGTVSVPATGQSQTDAYNGDTNPSKYTCSGNTMTMSTSTYKAELKKTSSNA